jgi:mannose-6-phosphate isomerase-like protein (cupin superfamily)
MGTAGLALAACTESHADDGETDCSDDPAAIGACGRLTPLVVPHTHDDYDQAVFVIRGEIQMRFGSDGDIITAGAGSYAVKPRGLAHSFWNPSETETVFYIELSANKTFEDFEASAEPLRRSAPRIGARSARSLAKVD